MYETKQKNIAFYSRGLVAGAPYSMLFYSKQLIRPENVLTNFLEYYLGCGILIHGLPSPLTPVDVIGLVKSFINSDNLQEPSFENLSVKTVIKKRKSESL